MHEYTGVFCQMATTIQSNIQQLSLSLVPWLRALVKVYIRVETKCPGLVQTTFLTVLGAESTLKGGRNALQDIVESRVLTGAVVLNSSHHLLVRTPIAFLNLL